MPLAALRFPPAPVARLIGAWYDREDRVVILLGLFVALWTSFQIVSYASIDLQPDLVEVFGWGLNPSPGYYKHPPLGALMAAAWFSVFPVADWSFHLLAMVNAAIGLYAVDLIARRTVSGDKRLLVLLFLLLTPFYQFHGQRFASNQVLLSTWPIATWCFLRAFETRSLAWAAAAGATAALAMLGKYYSAFLVASFIVAALAHPARLAYLRSASPWVSIAVGVIVLSPHLTWAATTGFQPLAYAAIVHAGATLSHVMVKSALYLAGALAYVALPVALIVLAARPDWAALREALWPADPDRRMLVVLLAVPLLLPVLVAIPTRTVLTPLWTMSAWFLLPIVLLAPARMAISRRAAISIAALVAAISLVVLAAAPALAWKRHVETDKDGRAWSRLISAELTRRWHAATHRPLRFVAGTPDFSAAATFYSADHPSFIPGFDPVLAPWATPEKLAREGWAALCRQGEAWCIGELDRRLAAWPGASRAEIEVTRTFLGRTGEPGRFVLGLFPPRG